MNALKEILKPVLALGLCCFVVVSLLAVTNYFTAPIILKNEQTKADSTRKLVLPEADVFALVEVPEQTLAENNVTSVYAADNGVGYAITSVVTGYHGEITVMFGFDPAGKLAGVEVLQHTETQGLGERITGKGWQGQFIGQTGELKTTKAASPGEGEIMVLTGATISSNAMTAAANNARAVYDLVKGAQS